MKRAALPFVLGLTTLALVPAASAALPRPPLPDVCGRAPSASQCRDTSFMNGPCYERWKGVCAPTYTADYNTRHVSAPGTTEPRLVPETSTMYPPGTVLQTKVLPYDSSDDVQGAAGTYASFMYKMRYQGAKKPGAITITRPISEAKGGILGELAPAIGGPGGLAATLPPAVQKLVATIFERMPTLVVDPRAQWEGNGNRIRSCEEYTYEKFYSFSKFEDLIAQEGYRVGIGHDRRAIFQALTAAVGADGFIHPRGPGPNVSLTTVDPAGPRNAFFAIPNAAGFIPVNYYEWLRNIEQFYTLTPREEFGFDPDVKARLLLGGSVPGWTWVQHVTNGNGFLASTTDDQFARMDLYKDQYAALLAENLRLQKTVSECLMPTDPAHANLSIVPSWCNADLVHRAGPVWSAPGPRYAEDVDASRFDIAVNEGNISLALLRARDELHCLETGDPTACDWSPREFVNRMLLEARSKEEAVYDKCMRFTGGDLTSPSSILTKLRVSPPPAYKGRVTITDPPSGPGIDGTASGDALDAVMFAFEEYVRTLGFDRDPTTNKIIVGQSSGDKQSDDSGDFGVELEYGAQWLLDNFDDLSGIYATKPRGLCDAEGHAGGHAKLRGKVLGEWTDLFEASASVDTDHLQGKTAADFSILGKSFYNPRTSGTLAVDLAFQKSSTQTLASARGIVPVLGVPVTLKAGVTGTIGVLGGLSGAGGSSTILIDRDCGEPGRPADTVTLGVHGHFEPFVSVDGYASASIDLGFMEGGVKGELQLARLGLPLDVEIGIKLDPPIPPQGQNPNGLPTPPMPPSLDLYTKSSLNVDFSTMDGHVSAFIETPFSSDEWTLLSWQGLHYRHNVFDRETHVPMSFLTTITHL